MVDWFHSRCYGLGLLSNVAIPGLAPAGTPDERALRIDLGSEPPWAPELNCAGGRGSEPAKVGLDRDRTLLEYPDGTRFFLDFEEPRIWASWPEPLTVEDTTTYLLGPVLGYYLRRRGHLCLHASSALIGGGCVAFLGAAGSGKSTLAAALALQGQGILSEDVTCLAAGSDGFHVQPGYPRIRLWNESAALIGAESGSLPLLTPNWDKRFLPLNGERYIFHDRPERLDALFLLMPRRDMGAAAVMEGLGGQRILSEVVANVYGNLLLDGLQDGEFAALGELSRAIPVRALTLNADGSRLFEACAWIERHALA